MRINSLFLTNSLTALIGGLLAGLAVSQPSIEFQACMAGGGAVLALAGWVWSRARFARSIQLGGSEDEFRSGIVELDEVFATIQKPWRTRLEEAQERLEQDTRELSDVKEFLGLIDRRKGSASSLRDSMPTRERLERILDSYGNQLDSNMRQVVSCGRELQRSVEDLVTGSETQSDLVTKTTAFVEEMSAKMMSICDTAETALDASIDVRGNIENGLQQVQDLVDEMKQVRNHASARERKLQTLGEHTREIEAIVETIGSLSSRTDLLALNASIESVRAGEHGRGFAVVAEEVRALAEQSAEAVKDISRRIEMIQAETRQSISVASGEHNQMNDVIERITSTLNALQEIMDAANASKNGLDQISNESTQQLKLTQDVIFTLEQSSETTQQNRSHAEGAHWTSKNLGEISDRLNESLSLFRRSENQNAMTTAS